jgi:histidine triad (HIT) family protein
MSEPTIFTKIINGEIPSHKIYEDDKTFAFLDIFPKSPGHVLVVPKIETDKIYELPDEFYLAIWQTAKKISKHMDKILGRRIFMKVIGTEVPHVHIHLLPEDENFNDSPEKASDKELAAMADKLRMV